MQTTTESDWVTFHDTTLYDYQQLWTDLNAKGLVPDKEFKQAKACLEVLERDCIDAATSQVIAPAFGFNMLRQLTAQYQSSPLGNQVRRVLALPYEPIEIYRNDDPKRTPVHFEPDTRATLEIDVVPLLIAVFRLIGLIAVIYVATIAIPIALLLVVGLFVLSALARCAR